MCDASICDMIDVSNAVNGGQLSDYTIVCLKMCHCARKVHLKMCIFVRKVRLKMYSYIR